MSRPFSHFHYFSVLLSPVLKTPENDYEGYFREKMIDLIRVPETTKLPGVVANSPPHDQSIRKDYGIPRKQEEPGYQGAKRSPLSNDVGVTRQRPFRPSPAFRNDRQNLHRPRKAALRRQLLLERPETERKYDQESAAERRGQVGVSDRYLDEISNLLSGNHDMESGHVAAERRSQDVR